MGDLRDRLRVLPTFPDELPVLDADAVPDDPVEFFRDWLEDAIAAGERQPAAVTLSTIAEDGSPASRTLIIKDIDERGIQVSSSRGSRKALQLAANPVATLLAFWRPLGRQVEITGSMVDLGEEASQADWRERPSYAGEPNSDWVLWGLRPRRFEFLQATHDRRHVRIEYLRHGERWSHAQPTTPAG